MVLEINYKSEHIVKDILKKYLALLGSVIYALLIVNIITNHTYTGFFYYAFLILHSISICAGLFIFFNPSKTIVYGIVGICYLPVLVFSKTDELNVLFCYVVILIAFWNQGFFVKRKFLKRFRAIAGFLIIIIIRAFLLKKEYLFRLYEIAPILFALVIVSIFAMESFHFERALNSKFIINLNDFPNLTLRQKNLIVAILNNQKYETFAAENNISISSVKRDATLIFDEFSCSSKSVFLTKFSQYNFYIDNQLVYTGK